MKKAKRVKWGDRKDGKKVNAPGLQTVMTALMPKRTEAEVYLNDTIDATELMKYLAARNEGKTDNKMTIFHCAITALARRLPSTLTR